MSLKELEKVLDQDGKGPGTPIGNDLRFLRYQKEGGKLEYYKCQSKADLIWKNRGAGTLREQELKQAFSLGPKNEATLTHPTGAMPSFKPDHVAGAPQLEWGKPYHFEEIKDWANMSDTGNLSAMLDYGERLKVLY